MQPNIVLIPDNTFCQKVFELRKRLLVNNIGNKDPRDKVLPHTTILYFEQELTNLNIDELVSQLSHLQTNQPITLTIKNVTNWDHKIVAIFDIAPLKNIKEEIENLLSRTKVKYNTEYKSVYGDTIGDHMKLARQIEPDKIEEVVKYFQKNLPSKINFDRVALIGYGTEEKDILWEKKLSI